MRLEATAVEENCCYFPRTEGPAADAVSAPTQRYWLLTPAPFSEGLSQTQGSCLTQRQLGAYLPTPQGKPIAHDRMMWAYNREALLPLSGTISGRELLLWSSWWDQVQRLLLKPNLCLPYPSLSLYVSPKHPPLVYHMHVNLHLRLKF